MASTVARLVQHLRLDVSDSPSCKSASFGMQLTSTAVRNVPPQRSNLRCCSCEPHGSNIATRQHVHILLGKYPHNRQEAEYPGFLCLVDALHFADLLALRPRIIVFVCKAWHTWLALFTLLLLLLLLCILVVRLAVLRGYTCSTTVSATL